MNRYEVNFEMKYSHNIVVNAKSKAEVITAYLCKYMCGDEKIKKARDGILKELGLEEE